MKYVWCRMKSVLILMIFSSYQPFCMLLYKHFEWYWQCKCASEKYRYGNSRYRTTLLGLHPCIPWCQSEVKSWSSWKFLWFLVCKSSSWQHKNVLQHKCVVINTPCPGYMSVLVTRINHLNQELPRKLVATGN